MHQQNLRWQARLAKREATFLRMGLINSLKRAIQFLFYIVKKYASFITQDNNRIFQNLLKM